MKKIKIGLIGIGIMGLGHLKTLKNLTNMYEITALCDTDPEKMKRAEATGIPQFTDYRELLDSGLCEAIGVVTPHPSHAEIAIEAFKRGLHVLCEKPLSHTVANTDALLSAAEKSGKVFATNFSLRTTSVNQVVRKWVREGKLGKIIRVDFVCSAWIRAQKYYDMQSWRGSWRGEGGGVLMNQAPHNLDLLYWWFRDMKSVRAQLHTRMHKIETEDEVDAVFTSHEGFPIRFYVTTGEAPGRDFLEIVGDQGTLIRENCKLTFRKLKVPISEMLLGTIGFPVPETKDIEVRIPEKECGAKIIWQNFAKAIRNGTELLSPGYEGLHAVEFANAMTLSHFRNREISLPINRKEYDQLYRKLLRNEKHLS